MGKATVSTGGHLIDANCKHNTGTLVESNGVVYNCTLNQTDIKLNSNKFYIMQVIKSGNNYVVFIRYGRIGEVGTISHKDHSSEYGAIQFFEKQFKTKTGNNWSDKDNFVKKNGKYFLTEIECADVESDSDSETGSDTSSEEQLDARTIEFLKLISNTTYMNNTLVQLEFDTEKMPLGKISQGQIDKAYAILDEINKNLDDDDLVNQLSSDFYTLIPYACGRRSPPLIEDKKIIGKFVNLLNELSQIIYGSVEVTKLKKNKNNMVKLYESLKSDIVPLDKSDEMYKILTSYVTKSKAPTHAFNYKIMDIFEVERNGERKLYDKFTAKKKIDNKMLLFHGTRVSNTISIFQNGLMCDLSKLGINVHITGKMFGLGIYTASSVSKSIQYCAYTSSDNIALIFVTEVALGKMLKKKSADSSLTAKTLPTGYNSTHGLGQSSYMDFTQLADGVLVPNGKLQTIKDNKNSALLYDEFIVYHDEQVTLRYVIQLKIT